MAAAALEPWHQLGLDHDPGAGTQLFSPNATEEAKVDRLWFNERDGRLAIESILSQGFCFLALEWTLNSPKRKPEWMVFLGVIPFVNHC